MDEEAGGIRQTRDIIDRKEERKMPEADIREELHRLRRETLAALEEWGHEKAAGLVKAAGHLERIQDPGDRSTAEELKQIKINVNYITYKRKERDT